MEDKSERCPACLGKGRVITADVTIHERHKLIPAKTVETTCPICHGLGTMPAWMRELPSVSFGYKTG